MRVAGRKPTAGVSSRWLAGPMQAVQLYCSDLYLQCDVHARSLQKRDELAALLATGEQAGRQTWWEGRELGAWAGRDATSLSGTNNRLAHARFNHS